MAPIHDAARRGDLEEVMRLIQEDPGVVSITEKESHERSTPLHYASLSDHVEVVCYLLDQEADIHARNRYGVTPVYRMSGGAPGSGRVAGIEGSRSYHHY